MNEYDLQIQVADYTDEPYIFKGLTKQKVDKILSIYRGIDADELVEITDPRGISYYFQKRHIIVIVVRESSRNE